VIKVIATNFDDSSRVRASERISRKVDDALPPETKLDLGRRFLPGAMNPMSLQHPERLSSDGLDAAPAHAEVRA